MFMILMEGPQSRETKADKLGFFRTCANIGFYETLEKAEDAVKKMQDSYDPEGRGTHIVCAVLTNSRM